MPTGADDTHCIHSVPWGWTSYGVVPRILTTTKAVPLHYCEWPLLSGERPCTWSPPRWVCMTPSQKSVLPVFFLSRGVDSGPSSPRVSQE